jgi:hypothetical protein
MTPHHIIDKPEHYGSVGVKISGVGLMSCGKRRSRIGNIVLVDLARYRNPSGIQG